MTDLFESDPQTHASDDDSFNIFWALYPAHPRKAAKRQCLEKWRTRKLHHMLPQIKDHLAQMKATKQWQQSAEHPFGNVPAPLVYLNQDRWEGATAASKNAPAVATGALPLYVPPPALTDEQKEIGLRISRELRAKFGSKRA